MAKGAIAKEEIFNKLLETFPGSFMADAKTLRIPWEENGTPLEIKVALTAAKDILGTTGEMNWGDAPIVTAAAPKPVISAEPTEEEKANVAKMLERLGL